MALTTDARKAIADALNDAGLLAFASVPATVTLPSVVIVPADPYALPDRIGNGIAYTASWTLDCLAQANDNESGLAAIEALVDAVLAALPKGVAADRVSRPLLDDMGAQGVAYVAEISVSAHLRPDPSAPPAAVPDPPGMPYADAWIETGGGWQYDLHWDLSPNDGGSPILRHIVTRDGVPPVTVDGNTGTLAAQFSLVFPVYCHVKAVNAAGESPASQTATIQPPI